LIIGDTPNEVFTVDSGRSYSHTGNIIILGTGLLMVKGELHLNGSAFVKGTGNFTVDGGQFHLSGDYTNLIVFEDGRVIFKNNALFHYIQTYVSQHNIICWGNARIEMSDSHVSADGCSEAIILKGSASYQAVNMTCPDWKTWYLHDQTSLTLNNVNIGGDIVFYDSPTMNIVDTVGIMPWLYFDNGAVIDYQFPSGFPTNPTDPVTITFDDSLPGVSGIPWSIHMENCTYVAWGINPYPGSNVTIRDSDLAMVLFRFVGPGQMDLQGIMRNNSQYTDTIIPVEDRYLRFLNTSVLWWKVDVIEGFDLTADAIVFSEMMVKQNSKAYLNNSVCEGQTIHLGALHNSFIDFQFGEVWSYVSVWDNATMVLRNSTVDYRKGQYIYQTRNIAHNNARLYCINTTFGYQVNPLESEPEAFDSAVTMYLELEGPPAVKSGQSADIQGSAWIKKGPFSPVAFKSYELAASRVGESEWHIIETSASQVKNDTLGTWQTAGLPNGSYTLRLTLWTEGDTGQFPTHDFPAEKVITLTSKDVKGGITFLLLLN
jgi:hypothetical protein